MSEEQKRFRSFAERYVVERASTFRVGHEREDAHTAVLDARSIYKNIEQVARQAWAEPPVYPPGATGPSPWDVQRYLQEMPTVKGWSQGSKK
jgi:hypothetical protein